MKKYSSKYFAKVFRCFIKYQNKKAIIIEAKAVNLNRESMDEIMNMSYKDMKILSYFLRFVLKHGRIGETAWS